jgi:hypothetical protein
MASNEKTSAAVAKIASKGLLNPASLTTAEIKMLSASALTQTADTPAKPVAKAPAKKKAKKKVAAKSAKRKPVKKRR